MIPGDDERGSLAGYDPTNVNTKSHEHTISYTEIVNVRLYRKMIVSVVCELVSLVQRINLNIHLLRLGHYQNLESQPTISSVRRIRMDKNPSGTR